MKLGTLKDSRAIAVQDAGSNHQFVALSSLGFNGSLQDLLPDHAALASLERELPSAAWQPLELHELAVPITAPPKIICVGLNYRLERVTAVIETHANDLRRRGDRHSQLRQLERLPRGAR